MKKVSKTNYNQNWQILRMTFAKTSKTQKWPKKHPQTKNSRNFKKLCKEAINEKRLKTNYNQN